MRGTGIFTVVLCLVIFPRFLSGNSDPRLAPALYVLGDSLLDSGNNNFLPTLARADFQPYGVNFPGGATGRFTNGRTVADFIGLGDVGDPCCTTWANGTSGCIPELQPCTPTDNHYFWDAFHLTEAVYSVIAARCINDTSVCMPTTIKALVQI
ncbi:hypothetical protein C3L33_01437, partial [Rhododendron williamsianum]